MVVGTWKAPLVSIKTDSKIYTPYLKSSAATTSNSSRYLHQLRRSPLKLATNPIMTLNRRRSEEGSNKDNEPEPNVLSATSTDELAGVSALARGAMEVIIIQTLQRYVRPIIMPLIRQVVKEHFESVKQEILASMKENHANKGITSVPKKLKLQFRNKVSLPVYTGKPLIGENVTPIEIRLIDAITGDLVKTGPESKAKLEIVGFRVGDKVSNDDSLTFEDFHKMILSEKKGKRTLQGNTCLQLKEGVCYIVDKLSFTHSSKNTRNGFYRLGAGVVDAALMNQVYVATTEAFLMRDGHIMYSEKHPQPSLFEKVRRLQQIGYKGTRYKRLEDAGVITVKDLLIILYTNPKRLEEILNLKSSSKMWDNIVKNAQASNGIFVYLDPSNEQKTGVVLDVKLQLKALIIDHRYIPVNHLSEQQKVDNQNLVKFASEHVNMLDAFEDEASVKEYLQSVTSFSSLPSLQVTHSSSGLAEALNNLNIPNHSPTLTSQSERGKDTVLFDDEMIYSTTYYQEHISFHQPNIDNTNGLNFGTATEPGTSSQTAGALMDTCGFTNTYMVSQCLEPWEELDHLLNNDYNIQSPNLDNVVMLASQTVSVCTAQTRWTKVSKLLRRNSVRERISHLEGMQPLKKHKCF